MDLNWWDVASDTCGWTYVICWSLVFYTQGYMNLKCRSVEGMSIDWVNYSFLGDSCYSIFNSMLYFSTYERQEYLDRFSTPAPVHLNDLVLSYHGVLGAIGLAWQAWFYRRRSQYKSNSLTCIIISTSIWFLVYIFAIISSFNLVNWIYFVYFCGYIKVLTLIFKDIPQLMVNFRRRSTKGWSIWNVYLDFAGGFFSLLQMSIDGLEYHSTSVFAGNTVKLGLAVFSMIFNLVFLLQHYVCFTVDPLKFNAGEEEDQFLSSRIYYTPDHSPTSSVNDFSHLDVNSPDMIALKNIEDKFEAEGTHRSFKSISDGIIEEYKGNTDEVDNNPN